MTVDEYKSFKEKKIEILKNGPITEKSIGEVDINFDETLDLLNDYIKNKKDIFAISLFSKASSFF